MNNYNLTRLYKTQVEKSCNGPGFYSFLKNFIQPQFFFNIFTPAHHGEDDFYLHLARLSFSNPSVSGHSVSNLPRSFTVRWTGTWQGWWLMGFRLTLTLCMHPCKSMKRSVSMWGDKVICHPWQRLIFSSCFWHSGPAAPLPQTTANCAVFHCRDLSEIFDPCLVKKKKKKKHTDASYSS